MVDTPTPFGASLARLRKRARLSQTQLADLAGMSRGNIAVLEDGHDGRTGKAITPRVDTIRRLADALAKDPETKLVEDAELADRHYLELATVAGYFTNREIPPRERAHALLLRDPRIMTAFEAFPDNLDDDDVDALRRHLDVFADMLRRSRR